VSDQPDRESKTESPSEKKLSDTIEKGNTPFSRELVSLGSLVAMIAVISLTIPAMVYSLTNMLRNNFEMIGKAVLETPSDAALLLEGLMRSVLLAVVPALTLIALGGVVGSLVQNVPSASFDRVAPKWDRLAPGKNIAKIIGKEALVEFGKTTTKFLALSILVYLILRSKISDLLNIGLGDPSAIPVVLQKTTLDILKPTAVFVLLIAIVDLVWTRIKWWNDLKMTRQEQKEEYKNSEGDPQLKQKRRMIAQKRLNSRMMADLPKATLLVVNPTHFAVALRYVSQEGGAPVVLAKGLDLVALKIREMCNEHKIPIVENKPLARSLFSSCEVGQMIPAEYYKAVAEVIHFVERKRQLSAASRSSGSSL
jgi:flagellar biosynthesis protein FlhB